MMVYEIKHGKHYILKKPKLEPLDAKYTSEEQFKKEWAEFEPLIVDVLGIGDWFQESPGVPNRTIKKSPISFPETFWKVVTVNGKVGWWNATYSHWIERKKEERLRRVEARDPKALAP